MQDLDVLSPDVALVQAAKTGNIGAFNALVKQHQSLVCSVAYALSGNLAESEEIAQEVFVVAWKRLPDLQPPFRVRGWLTRITQNLCQHHLRDQRSNWHLRAYPLSGAHDTASGEPSALERIISNEEE